MRVLWITNIVFPEAHSLIKGEGSLKTSGGWMIGMADALVQQSNIDLTVATVTSKVNKLTKLEGERITYYLLPLGKGNKRLNHDYEPLWRVIKNAVNPDVVHIHGTEFTHGLAYIEACGTEHVCVSIQGLISSYSYFYYYGLSLYDIVRSLTPFSIIRGGILRAYFDYKKRGEIEKLFIKKIKHVIGRTSWDRAQTWALNPDAIYHFGGETLRTDFYSGPNWCYKNCVPHSIFLSQAGIPIKGLHQVLRSLPLVLRRFPNTSLRIAGADITRYSSWKERLLLSNWGNLIRSLIKKNNLLDKVVFTGPLDGVGMKNEYLRCNLFICPSSIENSPNSLGEAQLLGVPTLASYVGGIPDMMRGDEDHLYRFEDVNMLAKKIIEVFELNDNINNEMMRNIALERHDPDTNTHNLLQTYFEVSL